VRFITKSCHFCRTGTSIASKSIQSGADAETARHRAARGWTVTVYHAGKTHEGSSRLRLAGGILSAELANHLREVDLDFRAEIVRLLVAILRFAIPRFALAVGRHSFELVEHRREVGIHSRAEFIQARVLDNGDTGHLLEQMRTNFRLHFHLEGRARLGGKVGVVQRHVSPAPMLEVTEHHVKAALFTRQLAFRIVVQGGIGVTHLFRRLTFLEARLLHLLQSRKRLLSSLGEVSGKRVNTATIPFAIGHGADLTMLPNRVETLLQSGIETARRGCGRTAEVNHRGRRVTPVGRGRRSWRMLPVHLGHGVTRVDSVDAVLVLLLKYAGVVEKRRQEYCCERRQKQ
jgi:hypothetical protein